MQRFFIYIPILIVATSTVLVGCANPRTQFNPIPTVGASNTEALKNIARLQERQGNLSKARETYEHILRREPKNAQVIHRLAIVSARLDDHAKAKQYFQQAHRLAPHDASILADFGYQMFLQNDFTAAEEVLTKAIQRDSNHQRAINNLEMVLGHQGRTVESYALFRRVVGEAEANANMAFIHVQLGEGKKTAERYSRALSLDGTLKTSMQGLLQIAELQKREKVARANQKAPVQPALAFGTPKKPEVLPVNSEETKQPETPAPVFLLPENNPTATEFLEPTRMKPVAAGLDPVSKETDLFFMPLPTPVRTSKPDYSNQFEIQQLETTEQADSWFPDEDEQSDGDADATFDATAMPEPELNLEPTAKSASDASETTITQPVSLAKPSEKQLKFLPLKPVSDEGGEATSSKKTPDTPPPAPTKVPVFVEKQPQPTKQVLDEQRPARFQSAKIRQPEKRHDANELPVIVAGQSSKLFGQTSDTNAYATKANQELLLQKLDAVIEHRRRAGASTQQQKNKSDERPLGVSEITHKETLLKTKRLQLVALCPTANGDVLRYVRLLESDQKQAVLHSVDMLGQMGRSANAAAPALKVMVQHEDPFVKIPAAYSLWQVKPYTGHAIPVLVDALDHPVPGVRWFGVFMLKKTGVNSESVIKALTKAVSDDDEFVRLIAADALEFLGDK